MRELLREVLALLVAMDGVELVRHRREALEALVHARRRARGLSEEAYLEQLRDDPAERRELVAGARVAVTAAFRDPEVFDALAALLRAHAPSAPLRAWSIGTATGEEAWSLASILQQVGADYTVLGTDLDPAAIAVAQAADYPLGQLVVSDAMRARVRFVEHDLLGPVLAPASTVVASFELVLLRNVLVHFAPDAIHLALDRVCRVLEPGGWLVLGRTEALAPEFVYAFTTVSPDLRIYRRRGI